MKPAVNRTSITKQVENILMEQILTGQLKAGNRIKTLHVARELGISQAPVREAIRWLEAGGYVHHTPNAGVRVRTFSYDELIEIYQVREVLEIHAIKLAISLLKSSKVLNAHVASMEASLEKMDKASKQRNKSEYAKHNTDFHRSILKMANNRVMLTTWESLAIQSRVLHTILGTDLSVDNAVKLHGSILTAIKTRDAELGTNKIAEHFDFIGRYHEARVSECEENF